ncbi:MULTISPECIES: hypothetical protein [unclassified Synechococcus]|uniref:hypothetical protein n=1 Tax=unclassified Synechococcus TaxID=2626047 RepID=UPI0039AF7195
MVGKNPVTSFAVHTLPVAEQLRKQLHLQRITGSSEGQAFASAVAEAIGLPLESLHEYVGPYPLFRPGHDNSTDTHQRFYGQHSQQSGLYEALCRRVVRLIGEPCYVQQIPTYRFGLPDNRWVGNFHRDSDFGHSRYELNAICALTPMWGSSALHVERSDASREFEPMELQVGEVILFDHIDRLHGCPINREGVSVASIDFRFVLARFAQDAFCSKATSINTGTPFLPGHYFSKEPLTDELY